MNLRFLLSFAVLLSIVSLAHAQEKASGKKNAPAAAAPAAAAADGNPGAEATGDEPSQIVAGFFGMLQKSRVEEAYGLLTKGSKIGDHPDELNSLKAKTTSAIEMFGVIEGYDLVENKAVGPHLMRRTYLSLGKEFPLRWRFYFYKADNRWRLVDLRVDDRLTGIFEEGPDQDAEPASGATK